MKLNSLGSAAEGNFAKSPSIELTKTRMTQNQNHMIAILRWYRETLRNLLDGSIDIDILLHQYFKMVGKSFSVSGISYTNNERSLSCSVGDINGFGAFFELNRDDVNLGNLSLYSNYGNDAQRESMAILSNIASVILLPIQNCMKYLSSPKSAYLDGVSGLGNLKGFECRLHYEIESAIAFKEPLCIAALQIEEADKLVKVGDGLPGEQLKSFLGSMISTTELQGNHCFWRTGNQFMIVFPRTNLQLALSIAKSIQNDLPKRVFLETEKSLAVNVYSGVAEFEIGEAKETLLLRSSYALAQAKKHLSSHVVACIGRR